MTSGGGRRTEPIGGGTTERTKIRKTNNVKNNANIVLYREPKEAQSQVVAKAEGAQSGAKGGESQKQARRGA